MKTEQLETFMANGLKAQVAVDQAVADRQAKKPRRARTLNPTCFLNATACREFLLEHAAATRSHKFTGVRAKTLRALNEKVRQYLRGIVFALPSKGKRI